MKNRDQQSQPKTQLATSFTGRLAGASLLLCGMVSACGQQDQEAQVNLDPNAAFVVVPRATSAETKALRQRALHAAGVIDQGGVGDDFYLAINRKEQIGRAHV